jgi:hypothetical protein
MTLEAEAAADYVQTEAPRLIRVAGATAISFALFDGANRALCLANQQDVHDDAWQTALGYRGDAVSLTVVAGRCPNGIASNILVLISQYDSPTEIGFCISNENFESTFSIA